MTLENFFEKFELFTNAPNAAGKMRELILRLAVRGRLTTREDSDEPVCELVKKLHRRREQRLGTPRQGRAVASGASSSSLPFTIPEHWTWIRLNEVGSLSGGLTPSKSNAAYWDGDLNWYTSKDVKSDDLADSGLKITELAADENGLRRYRPGCLFMVARSGILRRTFPVAINRAEATSNQDLKVLEPYLEGLERYLQIMLRGMTDFILTSLVKTGTTVESLKYVEFENQLFPLPPLAEIKRIEKRVEELMALCARLEAQQQEQETRHAALARASLARFAEAPTPANLNFLFHKSYAISPAEMRKAILRLAVQGKLVPQDTKEEFSADCLKRLGLPFESQLQELVDGNGIELPSSWLGLRFDDVAIVSGGVTLGRQLGQGERLVLPYLRVANVKRGEIDLSVLKQVEILATELDRYSLRENDLLMTEGGDWDKVGRAAVWMSSIPICLHQNHVFRARMKSEEFDPAWFELYFNSPMGRAYFESSAKQTTNLASINMRQVRGCPVPFPPPAEQRRIVRKVDQLMALVDRLEAKLIISRETASKLLDAVVAELTNPKAFEAPSRAHLPVTDYFVQLIPALLQEWGGKADLDDLNAAVSLLFLPKIRNAMLGASGDASATKHFSNFDQPLDEKVFLPMLQGLARSGAIDFKGGKRCILHLNPGEAPPISPIVKEDAKHLATLLPQSAGPDQVIIPTEELRKQLAFTS